MWYVHISQDHDSILNMFRDLMKNILVAFSEIQFDNITLDS